MNAWFTRDETHRQLSEEEQGFVAALSQSLDALRPAQVQPEETALAAEGPGCLICLIPHQSLGGLSLVVFLTTKGVEVFWAEVGGLGRNHDSLDLGVHVASFPAGHVAEVVERMVQELNRPLVLYIRGTSASVYIRDDNGKLREVASVGEPDRRSFFSRFRKRPPPAVVEVRLTDQAPPPITEPSGALEWFDLPPAT